jgi:hypothetical protein
MLGRRHAVSAGRVHDDDPSLSRGGHIYVVYAGAGTSYDLESFRRRYQISSHSGFTADYQGFILPDDLFQLFGLEADLEVNVEDFAAAQELDATRREVVADQDIHSARKHAFLLFENETGRMICAGGARLPG